MSFGLQESAGNTAGEKAVQSLILSIVGGALSIVFYIVAFGLVNDVLVCDTACSGSGRGFLIAAAISGVPAVLFLVFALVLGRAARADQRALTGQGANYALGGILVGWLMLAVTLLGAPLNVGWAYLSLLSDRKVSQRTDCGTSSPRSFFGALSAVRKGPVPRTPSSRPRSSPIVAR